MLLLRYTVLRKPEEMDDRSIIRERIQEECKISWVLRWPPKVHC